MAQYIDFKPSDYFSTITYTGDGEATRAITGVGFQPDFYGAKIMQVDNIIFVIQLLVQLIM